MNFKDDPIRDMHAKIFNYLMSGLVFSGAVPLITTTLSL